jgi:hypothetical protein
MSSRRWVILFGDGTTRFRDMVNPWESTGGTVVMRHAIMRCVRALGDRLVYMTAYRDLVFDGMNPSLRFSFRAVRRRPGR